MKMKQIADRLGKHDNTIRNYARQYAEFLSSQPAKGEHRIFTDDDARIIAFISHLSDNGMRHEEIHQALKTKLAEGTPFQPLLPSVPPSEQQNLITVAEMEAQLAAKDSALKEAQVRLEELRRQLTEQAERQRQEREAYLQQIRQVSESYMAQIARLSEEIGKLKAQIRTKK
jgi:DNA-binding transcriptional MerR regulator